VRDYIEPLVAILEKFPDRVSIRNSTRVVNISKRNLNKDQSLGDDSRADDAFRLLCVNTQTGGEEEVFGDIVFDTRGCYSYPRNFGSGGIPALNESRLASRKSSPISYYVPDVRQNGYAGKSVLVIGSGYSAITTINNLLELKKEFPNTTVHWFTRRNTKDGEPGVYAIIKGDSLPQRASLCILGNALAAETASANARAEHHVVKCISKVEDVQGRVRVHYCPAGANGTAALDVDHIVSNCGYRPDTSLSRELQVHYCWASDGPMNLAASLLGAAGGDCLAQASAGVDLLRNPEANFFILGGKSYGRNSSFLMKLGIEQVETVFNHLTACL